MSRESRLSKNFVQTSPTVAPFVWRRDVNLRASAALRGGTSIALLLANMAGQSRLRHLEAAKINTPAGKLDHVAVLSPTAGSLGQLEGVIIDPNERHVRYYVVESRGWLGKHRYLLPETPLRLDPDGKALHVDLEADDLSQLAELEGDEFPAFTDDDFVTALFAHR